MCSGLWIMEWVRGRRKEKNDVNMLQYLKFKIHQYGKATTSICQLTSRK